MKIVVLALAFTLGATTCLFAQDAQDTGQGPFKSYGLLQSGVFNKKAAVGVDFGQEIGRNVQMYGTAGWQQDSPTPSAVHATTGLKLMMPYTAHVRPYVLGGLGMIHFRTIAPQEGVNRLLAEAGAGFAVPVSGQGYIDIGYKYMQPFNGDGRMRFKTNGVYAGFGFRY